jgi:hypothetical protein
MGIYATLGTWSQKTPKATRSNPELVMDEADQAEVASFEIPVRLTPRSSSS